MGLNAVRIFIHTLLHLIFRFLISNQVLASIKPYLDHNDPLEELELCDIDSFNLSTHPVDWLVPLLESISSQEHFRQLSACLRIKRRVLSDNDNRNIDSQKWRLIEDILLDRSRFPGKCPVFDLVGPAIYPWYNDETEEYIRTNYSLDWIKQVNY